MKFSSMIAAGLLVSMGLISCDHVVSPENTSVATSSKFEVVNNRLVFKNKEAFMEIRNYLMKSNTEQIQQWESKANFKSLRSESYDGKNSAATELMESFGFPPGYASFINPKGEFQIGSTIMWYNKGFRHEVSNEEELTLIKANTSNSQVKYPAGISKIKSGSDPNARVTRVEYQGRDNKYHVEYDIPTSNALRRYTYETFVFTDQYVGPSRSTRQFYTALNLHISLEYLTTNAFGGAEWRQARDPRDININTIFSAFAVIENGMNPSDFPNLSRSKNFNYNYVRQESRDADQYYILGDGDLYCESLNGSLNFSDDAVNWSYEINGTISQSKPGDFQRNGQPATYTVSGILW